MHLKKQASKPTRLTLNKKIAAAPTHAKKWEIALHGGDPPTAIQQLPSEALGLRVPSLHGREWQSEAIERLKQKFAELLFQALMGDDTKPFEELIQAMVNQRKVNNAPVRSQELQRYKKPSKKELGRRLRLALLNLRPDDLLSIQTVKVELEKVEREFAKYHGYDFSLFSDDSSIYKTMKELKLRLLQPGDAARWIYDGKIVRELRILPEGTPKISGMTREQIDALPFKRVQTNF